MKNAMPQLENGYTKIANELLEKFAAYRISGEEWQVLLVILRKTYGFHKKEDLISLTQFTKLTSLKRQNVFRALRKLSSKKIIGIIKKDGNQINSYRFNKLYTQWKTIIKKDGTNRTIIKKDYRVSPKLMMEPSSKTIPTKDNKDTYTKDINNIIPFFEEMNPSYERIFSNKTQRDSLARLIKKYGKEWIIDLIKKLPEIISKPYAPRITNPYELETKLGQLKIFLQQEGSKQNRFKVERL